MKILITGSEGTLGLPLQNELMRRSHDVYGLIPRHIHKQNVYRADTANYRELERVIEKVKPDMVYHLAAEFGRTNGEEFYERVWETNVIGTRNVLELQVRLGFNLIFASSSEMYGDIKAPWLIESMNPEPQLNDYAISKFVGEIQCNNFRKRYGSKIMMLRFFNAYGPGEYYTPYRSVVCLFCYHAIKGMKFNVYKNYHRVFMYIDDFTPTLANACERFIDGEIINIGGKEYRSVADLADIVLKATGANRDLVNYLNEDKHNLTNKRPVINKAIELLGHNPTIPLEIGVEKTVKWMKEIYG